MDWQKAIDNVEFFIPLYADLGPTGYFGLMFLLELRQRYNDGERSADLYESMMGVE